jgi:outer membrane protein OmpA-like peptidoglycan-associated protein
MSQNVSKLKELLFDSEARRLDDIGRRIDAVAAGSASRHDELSKRVDVVFERAGSEERLLHSVAGIIDGALREAEVARHDQLSRAVAPLVVKTIKSELKNSEAEMVDALYPITGKLVNQYVSAAITDLMADINRRLGGRTPSQLEKEAKSRGLSLAEYALSESQRLAVEELFLIQRGSGVLVAHWEKAQTDSAPTTGQRGSNRDVLIAGYISGISSFAEEAFSESHRSLRTLDLAGERIVLRASQAYILAARIAGSAPAAVEQAIDATFLEALDAYRDALSRPDGAKSIPNDRNSEVMARIAESLESRLNEVRTSLSDQVARADSGASTGPSRLYVLVAALLLPLIAWLAWGTWNSWRETRTGIAVKAVLGSLPELSGYPIDIRVKRGGRGYELFGLVPSEGVRSEFLGRLRTELSDAEPVDHLTVLPTGPTGISSDALRQQLESIELRLSATAAERAIVRAASRLNDLSAALPRLEVGGAFEKSGPTSSAQFTAATAEARMTLQAIDGMRPLTARNPGEYRQHLVELANRLSNIEALVRALVAGAMVEPPARRSDAVDATAISEEISASSERIAASVTALSGMHRHSAALNARLDALRAPAPASSRSILADWIRDNAIFFGNGTEFRDDNLAAKQLDELAELIRRSGAVVRIVGYTDEKGTQALNSGLATARAERVAATLQERRISRDRMIALGRPSGLEISREVGAGSPSRRVEFELAFTGEAGGR